MSNRELHIDPEGNWYPVEVSSGPPVCADSTTEEKMDNDNGPC